MSLDNDLMDKIDSLDEDEQLFSGDDVESIAPSELWMLYRSDTDKFVRCRESEGDPFLVYLSEQNAQVAADYHNEEFFDPSEACYPVRVK